MMGNNQNLFFSQEEKGRAFSDVLKEVQEYISSKYSTLMVEGGNDEVKQQVKRQRNENGGEHRLDKEAGDDHRQAKQDRFVDVKHRCPGAEARHFTHVFTAGKNQHRDNQRQRCTGTAHPDHVEELLGDDMRRGNTGLNGSDVIGLVFHPQWANDAVDH